MQVLHNLMLGFNQDDSDGGRVNRLIVFPHVFLDEVPQLRHHLDAGIAGPAHDEGEESFLLLRVLFRTGLLEGPDDVIFNEHTIVQGLQGKQIAPGGVEVWHIGNAAQCHDEVVEVQRARGGDYPAGIKVNLADAGPDKVEPVPPVQSPDGIGDVAGLDACHGYLVQQGGEQEEILFAHHGGFHVLISVQRRDQVAQGVRAAEPAPQYQYLSAAHVQFSMCRTLQAQQPLQDFPEQRHGDPGQ